MWTYWWSGFFDGSIIASLWPSYWPTLEQPYRYFTVWATIGNAECIIHHRTPTTQARGSEHTHKYPLCIGTEIHVNLIWSRTHEGCTDCDTSTVWVSAPPSVDGASVKSICFWPWLADWREPMEWDLIWCQTEHLDEAAYMDFARACVCVCMYWTLYYSLWCLCASWWELVQRGARFESPLLDRMERLESEQVLHGEKDLLMLWLIKRTAVMWSHIHMPYQHSTQSCQSRKNQDSISGSQV